MLVRDADLRMFNTLRLPARAELLAQPDNDAALLALLQDSAYRSLARRVIGEGSNLVLRGDLPGLVIRPRLAGVELLSQDDSQVVIQVGAGENWDALVAWTLRQGWQGLENLSLIPGSVGAAPYQNIGAYGVELADTLDSLSAVHLQTGGIREFSAVECRFGYRDSLFKSSEPGQWLVTRVRLRLRKRGALSLGYADLQNRFEELPVAEQNAGGVRKLVCQLRRSKLPDPQELANAGSFFKNPVVSEARHRLLKQQYPRLVSYPLADGNFKLAAGWLIEAAGWKGRREDALGMHAEQALVLVNYGGASGEQVLAFAARVAAAVHDRFGVQLEREPVCLP